MARKSGLGKGLDALIQENALAESGEAVSLSLHEIELNRGQPRKKFDEEALAELADSIALHGVLQPLLVRPIPGGYQLVAGERRWRASQRAGLSEVPVVIREMSDKEMMELALIENLQREDLNPMEEAKGYQTLMESYQLTQEEVAKQVGKSRPAVANALRLLNLPEPVCQMLLENTLSAGHAKALLAFPGEEEQIKAAEMAIRQGLSVRVVEEMTRKRGKSAKESKEKPSRRNSFFAEVELAMSEQLGRKVTVHEKKGVLELEFYSQEDLQNLANIFHKS